MHFLSPERENTSRGYIYIYSKTKVKQRIILPRRGHPQNKVERFRGKPFISYSKIHPFPSSLSIFFSAQKSKSEY